MLLLDTLLYYALLLVTYANSNCHYLSVIHLSDCGSYLSICRHTLSPWALLGGCSFSVHRSDSSIVYQALFQKSLPNTSRTCSSHVGCFPIWFVTLSGSDNRHLGSTGPSFGGHAYLIFLGPTIFTWCLCSYLIVTPCQVPTIATLAALGHHVVAVDLPGYGKTKVSPTVPYL